VFIASFARAVRQIWSVRAAGIGRQGPLRIAHRAGQSGESGVLAASRQVVGPHQEISASHQLRALAVRQRVSRRFFHVHVIFMGRIAADRVSDFRSCLRAARAQPLSRT
jgi:hypothetical protein